MPAVEVSQFCTVLKPFKSYKMPVLSPRHSSSATLTGTYRSTLSSSSLSRPYYNSSYSPRFTTYTERFSSKIEETKRIYSRHSSISDDREKSSRRDSLSRERDVSLTRDNSRSSTINVIESVADLRNKYSPANYVPAVLRKTENISRSKSINDIGRPPLESKNSVKTKKVTEFCNNRVFANNTNPEQTDNNGNRPTVSEIRKKFDPNFRNNRTSIQSSENEKELLVGGNKLYSRPPKCFKSNLDVQNDGEKIETVAKMSWDETETKLNHTTDYASFIHNKEDKPVEEETQEERENSEGNDISTSPRLNRLQASSSVLSSSRGSPPALREDPVGPTGRQQQQGGLNGLKNIGNTCFMNSVIQCLSNTRQLLEYVRADGYMDDINTSISSMKGALIKAFSQVIQELWSPDSQDRVVNTLALKSQIQRFAPRFMGYAQQDAQEFLRYLLEGLHEDVNRVTAKPQPILTEIDEKLSDAQKSSESWHRYLRMDNSRVVDIFVGQLKSTLRCTHCGHCSVTFDPFWDLSLPIPQRQGPLRLAQCLEHFTREETMDGDEKPTCSKCRERRKCTKSFSIQKFPRVLVIHLKRFSPTERFRGKLNLVIDFPLQGLDLSPFAASSTSTDCLYNLYAISNHSGTTYSGHYTAYCKHPYSQAWHEYNDSRVSSISPKNVVSSEAYVLFYELMGPHAHL